MPDVVFIVTTVAFFALGALYIAACARILARAGDIDEPVDEAVEVDHEDLVA